MSGEPSSRRLVVALDGPSGVGKTTAGMRLAERLGAVFVDTGLFYRAVTFLALNRGTSLGDQLGLAQLAWLVSSQMVAPSQGCRVVEVLADGEAAGEALRGAEVEARVSEVASQAGVRAALLERQ